MLDTLGFVATDDRKGPLLTRVEVLLSHVSNVYTLGILKSTELTRITVVHTVRSMAPSKTPPKPRPPRRKTVLKEEIVPIRMTTEQKEMLAAVAQGAGMGLSTWLLMLGLKAARE